MKASKNVGIKTVPRTKFVAKTEISTGSAPRFFSVGKKMSFLGNYFRKTYCKIKEDVVYYCVRIFWMPNEYR